MKKTIYRILFAGMALLAVSCTEENKVTVPSFPEKQDFLKSAGETVELSIEPNMAWELSLDAPATRFWFEEAGVKRSNLTGSAGNSTITVHITEEVSLDEDYMCTVNMTMGKETKAIATIKVVAGELYFKLYPAVWDNESNGWVYDENGLVYSSEAKSGIELIFDEEDMNFMCFAKVESNFEWSIPATELTWLEPVGETDKGIVEVVFTAKESAYPAGGASDAEISVARKNGNPAEDNIKLTASIPDYRKVCVPMGDWSSSFVYSNIGNFDGDYESESIDSYYFFAAADAEVCVASFSYGMWDNYVEWLEYEKLPVDAENASKNIHEQGFKLIVRPNSYGPARSAYILIKTGNMADEQFFNSDWTELTEGVYCYAVEQDGADGIMEGPLASVSGDIENLKDMTFELLSKSANKWLYENFEAKYVYRLASSKATASISFEDIPSTYTYEIISTNNTTAEKTVKENWWIGHKYENNMLQIQLDPISGNSWTDAEADKYAENQADGFSKESLRYEGAYLLIKDGDKTLAVIDCVYDPSAVPVTDGVVDFAGEKPAASYVNKITIGDLSSTLQEAISGSALYTTSGASISNPLNTTYPVYKVKVPKSSETLDLKVLNDPDKGYFIIEDKWISGKDVDTYKNTIAKDGVFSFIFNDKEAHETVFTCMQSGLCVALINIVKE